MKIFAKWYPKSLPDRAQWHKNFALQATQDGADYGLPAAEQTQIQADMLTVNYFNDQTTFLDAELEAFRAARAAYLDGERGAPAPDMPSINLPALPPNALVAIAERTERYAGKIKASDNYSPSVGEAYGIVSAPATTRPTDTLKPTAKATALAEFKVAFRVSMQKMRAVQMQMERDGDPVTHKSTWTDGDIVDDTPPLVPAKPETRRYRFYFTEKNQIVGESSDIYEITVHA